jgi:hypothetical protein
MLFMQFEFVAYSLCWLTKKQVCIITIILLLIHVRSDHHNNRSSIIKHSSAACIMYTSMTYQPCFIFSFYYLLQYSMNSTYMYEQLVLLPIEVENISIFSTNWHYISKNDIIICSQTTISCIRILRKQGILTLHFHLTTHL